MTVDILCRVVDNFGDIGFAYRLARALSELPDPPAIRLVVDDLRAFAGLCPEVDPAAGLQTVAGWTVARWTEPGDESIRLFRAERPRVVVECYACGRPDWFEAVLFDPDDRESRTIVNLEYLSAESWASEYHLLPSLTRSPLVKKFFFMPGFAAGTGGLLQDASFIAAVDSRALPSGAVQAKRTALAALAASGDIKIRPAVSAVSSFGQAFVPDERPVGDGFLSGTADLRSSRELSFSGFLSSCPALLPDTVDPRSPCDPASVASLTARSAAMRPMCEAAAAGSLSACGPLLSGPVSASFSPESAFWFLLFSYEHDFTPILADLSRFAADRPLLVVLAAGRSAAPFLDAWSVAGRPFPVLSLPFVSQPVWDSFLVAADFPVVRGEETLARAALMGRPFLWQCYPFPPDALPSSAPGAANPCAESPEATGPGNPASENEVLSENPRISGDPVASGGQNPKVFAVLDQLRSYLTPADFALWERLTLSFNGISGPEPASGDLLAVLRRVAAAQPAESPESTDLPRSSITNGFADWSADVRNLGNLATNLMTFIAEIG